MIMIRQVGAHPSCGLHPGAWFERTARPPITHMGCGASSEASAARLVEEFDANGDGVLDRDEQQKLVKAAADAGVDKDRLERELAAADEFEIGRVNATELVDAVRVKDLDKHLHPAEATPA